MHIGVSNGLIVAKWLSEYRKTDGEIAPNLIHQVGRIDSITADKAYDQSRVYEASNDRMKLVKSTFTQGQMQSFQLRMKLHLDSEINISSPSTKTVP